jgi:hypothetical protein
MGCPKYYKDRYGEEVTLRAITPKAWENFYASEDGKIRMETLIVKTNNKNNEIAKRMRSQPTTAGRSDQVIAQARQTMQNEKIALRGTSGFTQARNGRNVLVQPRAQILQPFPRADLVPEAFAAPPVQQPAAPPLQQIFPNAGGNNGPVPFVFQ